MYKRPAIATVRDRCSWELNVICVVRNFLDSSNRLTDNQLNASRQSFIGARVARVQNQLSGYYRTVQCTGTRVCIVCVSRLRPRCLFTTFYRYRYSLILPRFQGNTNRMGSGESWQTVES